MDSFSKLAVDFLAMDSALRAVLFGGIFLLSLAVTLWLFYDAQNRGVNELVWKALVAFGTIITLPALVISAFNLDVSRQGLVNPLSYVALGGAAIMLVSAASYLVVSRRRVSQVEPMPAYAPPPVVEEPTFVQTQEPEATRMAHLEETRHLAFLVEKNGVHAGTIHWLRDRTIIGRSGDCDVALDDEEVSRQHTSIRVQDGRFVLRDLDSTNGTWLMNGDDQVRIENPHPLREHDRIRLGTTVLVFTEVSNRGSSDAGGNEGGGQR